MIIHLDELSEKIQTFTFEKRLGDFPVLEDISATGDCKFADPIDIRLGAKRLGEMVAVEGRAAATVHLTCNRCLAEFQSALQPRFTLTYCQIILPKNYSAIFLSPSLQIHPPFTKNPKVQAKHNYKNSIYRQCAEEILLKRKNMNALLLGGVIELS